MKFGRARHYTKPVTTEIQAFRTIDPMLSRDRRRAAIEAALKSAQDREDIAAQHGPCYRIDPKTGKRTLITE